jgi:hypothetical protein
MTLLGHAALLAEKNMHEILHGEHDITAIFRNQNFCTKTSGWPIFPYTALPLSPP